MAKRRRRTVPESRLSRSEWELMRICWRLRRATVRQVLVEDRRAHQRDYRTILTFMSRMAKKGWLKVDKEGNTNYYTPAIVQKKALTREIRRFLKEVVGPEAENRQLLRKELRTRQGPDTQSATGRRRAR